MLLGGWEQDLLKYIMVDVNDENAINTPAWSIRTLLLKCSKVARRATSLMSDKHFPSGCPIKVMQDPGQSSATWCQPWLLA